MAATTTRKMTDRSTMVEIDGVLHVSAPRPDGTAPNSWADVVTMCGVSSPAFGGHEHEGRLPLTDATCSACVEAEMATPFTHTVTITRRKTGRGQVKGSAMTYGVVACCTCGWSANVNKAPSQGGTATAEALSARHLADLT